MNAVDDTFPSMFTFIRAALTRRAWITRSAFFCSVLFVAVGLLTREYDARARVAVQQPGGSLSALAGIAAQVGLPVGADGQSDSPSYFAEYLRSRDVLDTLARMRFTLGDSAHTQVSLIEILDLDTTLTDRELKIEAIEELRDRISTSSDLTTGMISIRVRMPEESLAEDVLARLISVAEANNRLRKGSIATAERVFVEGRLAQAMAELASAQDSLELFLETNRLFRGSARLELQAQNLQRTVELRQAVVVSLSQAVESARIEEVRNTPVLSLVESPTNTAEPSAKIVFLIVLGGLTGVSFGAAALIAIGIVEHGRSREPEELRRLSNLVRESIHDPFGAKRPRQHDPH